MDSSMLFDLLFLFSLLVISGYVFVGALLGYLFQDRFYRHCLSAPDESVFKCMMTSVIAWPLLFPFGIR